MRKKKIERNYLEQIPKTRDGLHWYMADDQQIILEVENTGVFNRFAQIVFKRPKITKVHLDEHGSFLWPLIDGKRSVMELAALQKEAFGEAAEPLYPRIVKYFQILESYGFISFVNQESFVNQK